MGKCRFILRLDQNDIENWLGTTQNRFMSHQFMFISVLSILLSALLSSVAARATGLSGVLEGVKPSEESKSDVIMRGRSLCDRDETRDGSVEQIAQRFAVRVRIKKANGTVEACSGILLSPYEVMTSKHCFKQAEGEPVPETTVFIREKSGKFEYKIPVANEAMADSKDMALLKLKLRTDQYEGKFPKVATGSCDVGSRYVVAGAGLSDDRSLTCMKLADYGTAKIVKGGRLLLERQPDQDSAAICSADSGGPILCQQQGEWVVAGISQSFSPSESDLEKYKKFDAAAKEALAQGRDSDAQELTKKVCDVSKFMYAPTLWDSGTEMLKMRKKIGTESPVDNSGAAMTNGGGSRPQRVRPPEKIGI